MRIIINLAVALTLVCGTCFAQQNSSGGTRSAGSSTIAAPATAKTPAATATRSAATGTPVGPALARFRKLSEQAQNYYKQFQTLQQEYPKATPARQKEIRDQAQKMAETMQSFKKPLIEAAKAAFKEAPNKDKDVHDFLLNSIIVLLDYDDYEVALAEANDLIKSGMLDSSIFEIAGYAAYNTSNYKFAEQAIAMAAKKGELKAPSKMVLENLPYYKEAWIKEKAARDANDQNKDCPIVKMETSAGTMTIQLFANEAPNTVANFLELVNKGFYNGLTFHRVMQSFMAQGGDPKGDGSGGPGYCIPCETDNPLARKHFRGSLSMAHAGKDTGGSQFFITFVPTKHLDGVHTVFGRVIGGMDVLAKIQREPDAKAPGMEPTVINKITVEYMPSKSLPPVKKLPEKKFNK